MNSKIANDATDALKRDTFCKYSNGVETLGQVEADLNSWDIDYCTEPPDLKEIPMVHAILLLPVINVERIFKSNSLNSF